jgi:hypothetical protein
VHQLTASAADFFRALYGCEGADHGLDDIAIYPSSDTLCRSFGARALTVGTHIHFRAGEFAPHTRRGFWLLAHEVAHVVQQRRGPVTHDHGVGPGDAPEEAEASAAADAALAGRPYAFAPPAPAWREGGDFRCQGDGNGERKPVVVQRYMGWEHLMLGTAGPDEARELVKESEAQAGGTRLLAYSQMLEDLGREPENVDGDRIADCHPGATPVRLPGSGLIVTLGELSILPDYLSRPEDIANAPRRFVLPLIQSVREWNIRELRRAAGEEPRPAGRIARRKTERPRLEPTLSYPSLGGMAEIAEGIQVTRLAARCGFPPWERYQSVVSRNAGHFAPFSWYRWQEYHLKARSLAGQAHRAADAGDRDMYTARAWISAGYADHFLQDSFAAGHLINKMLIMQWYAEALAKSKLPVPERRLLAAVTTGAQPHMHGPGYYCPVADERDPQRLVPSLAPDAPAVSDPQAVVEASTLDGRIAASGVTGKDPAERRSAYSAYLTLLRSSLVQSAAGAIHGYLNDNSLVVAAGADGERYQLWGDWTMLRGEETAARAAEAGELSRQAIAELLAYGETGIGSRQVFELFPNHVEQNGTLFSLADWHKGLLKDQCFGDFFRMKSALVMRAATTIAFRHLGVPSADG